MVQIIKKQLAEGVSQRRVGLVSTGAPARQHSIIMTMEGKEVGSSKDGLHSCFTVLRFCPGWQMCMPTLQGGIDAVPLVVKLAFAGQLNTSASQAASCQFRERENCRRQTNARTGRRGD